VALGGGGCLIALFVVAVLGMGRLGNEFLPQLDDGQVNVRIHLPPGTTPEQTDQASRMVENEIRNMPHVESVFAIVGGHLHGGVVSERPGTARMDVVLTDASERPDMPAGLWVAEAQDRLRDARHSQCTHLDAATAHSGSELRRAWHRHGRDDRRRGSRHYWRTWPARWSTRLDGVSRSGRPGNGAR
jgi:multidrug efflux pump subunit AcrB